VSAAAITVLVPVKWYWPSYLRQALDSVRGQTSPAWRLLVVCEPDNKTGVRERIADHLDDDRAGLILNEGRKLAGALNTGMRHARTEFVAILLGDDLWSPAAVEVLTQHIRSHPEADFLHSSRRIIDARGAEVGPVQRSREDVRAEHFGPTSPVKHLLCWRRSMALAAGGMDETLNSVGADDFDFPWLMAEQGAVFHAVPDCLYLYRQHRSCYRLTTHLPRSVHARELRRILRKHGVGWLATQRAVLAGRHGYMRQCLYRSPVDRWLKRRVGFQE